MLVILYFSQNFVHVDTLQYTPIFRYSILDQNCAYCTQDFMVYTVSRIVIYMYIIENVEVYHLLSCASRSYEDLCLVFAIVV